MLAMMIVLGLLGSAFLFDVFDGEGSNQNVETPPEDETGQVLSYDGSYLLEGTEGDDTLPAGQGKTMAPDAVNLLGGDDIATIEVNDPITVSGGDGDDSITATGVLNILEGGAGNDTLTADDSNQLFGGEGDDVLNFTHGSYNQGELGRVNGGAGDDTINVRADAFVLDYIRFDVGGVEITGGSGSDEFNVTYEFNNNFNFEATDRIVGSFIRVSDFDPSEDTLVIEIDRNDDTTDRDITVALNQTKDNDTYTSSITLTFEETSEAAEATNILTILSSAPFTLDDIQLIGV